jgi:signal transduction histidine kinase
VDEHSDAGRDHAAQRMDELLHARAAELTALSRHLMLVAEEEKAELARELHDTFGSNLTAINMDLNWIARRLPNDRPDLKERLQRALRMLGETVAAKQEVIDRLRPSHLDTLGVAIALRTLCRELETCTGGTCTVDAGEDFDGLDRSSSIALYRVAQEALDTIDARTTVHVDLHRVGPGVRLRIRAASARFIQAVSQAPPSLVFVRLRERIHAVGGTLQVIAEPSSATIDAFIPLAERVGKWPTDRVEQSSGGGAQNGSYEQRSQDWRNGS